MRPSGKRQRKKVTEVKKLIDKGLIGTSVTVVLIGAETSTRKFVNYEIEQSIARGNGLLGIKVSGIKDKDGKTDVQGAVPARLTNAGAPSYTWDRDKFGDWVEAAYTKAHPKG